MLPNGGRSPLRLAAHHPDTDIQVMRGFLRKHWPFLVVLAMLGAASLLVYHYLRHLRQDGRLLEERVALAQCIFNCAEGAFWLILGVMFFLRKKKIRSELRKPYLVAAITFILFSGTDFVEMGTGAWYDPPWLLAWNLLCVASLILCFFWYVNRRRKSPPV